jgi:predicted  nucleic acid-binding Zn-ribbon protein
MTKAYVLFWVMVVASLCLSVVSGYETFLGLRNFMPEGFIGAIFALIFTFAVQALLFVISWRIAEHLLDPWRKQALSFSVWLICAIFSGYFSYFGFYQATGGRDENTRVNAVQVAQADILRRIEADIAGDLADRHQGDLLDNAAYAGWVNGLEDLIDIAQRSERDIERLARDRETELTAQRTNLQQTLDQLQQDRIAADADLQSAERAREALRDAIAALESRSADLAAQMTEAEAAVDGLRTQLEVEGRTGQGPRFREIEIDLGSAEAELERLRTVRQQTETRLAERREDRIRSDIEAEQNIEESRLNAILGEIDSVEARIAEITAEIEGMRAAANIDFGTERQDLSQRISRLRQQDYAGYEEAIARCEEVTRQITQAGLADRVEAVRCNYADLAPVLADLRQRQSRLEDFRATCTDGRARVVRAADAPPQIDGIIAQLQNTCAAYVVTPALDEEIGRTIADLAKRRGDEALAFDRAGVALMTDRQSNAVISAFFAIIVDLLVLLCALVGRNVGQPEAVRAIDRVMADLSMPDPDEQQQGYVRRYVIPPEGNDRALVQPVLLRLLSAELAMRSDTMPGAPEVMLLRRGSMERLKQWRTEELRGVAEEVRPMTAPSRANRRRT